MFAQPTTRWRVDRPEEDSGTMLEKSSGALLPARP